MTVALARRGYRPTLAGRRDNFDRADSATSLGTPSDGGAGYTLIPSSSGPFAFGINSGKAYLVSGGFGGGLAGGYWTALLATAKADIDLSVDVSRPATGGTKAMVAFGIDPANDNQGYMIQYGTGTLWLVAVRTNAQVGAVLGHNDSFSSTAGTLRVTRVAATGLITVYFNGVQQFQATDLTYSAGMHVGFGALSAADADRWDNLVAA